MSRNAKEGFWYKSMPRSFAGEGVQTGHADMTKGKAAASVVTDFELESGVFPFPQIIGTIATLKKEGNAVAYHNQYQFWLDNPSDQDLDVVLTRYANPTNGATISTVIGTFALAGGTNTVQSYNNLSGDVYVSFTNTATPSAVSTISYAIVLF